MTLPIYQIDAFTDALFAGNPAAVVPLDRWPADSVLQAIAAENNLPETAFFAPDREGVADYRLRWFTPTIEVELCGHATLASGWLILNRLEPKRRRVRFATMAGPLTVSRPDGEEGEDVALELDFPARPATQLPMPKGVADALGKRPSAFWLATKYMAVFDDPAHIRALKPDLGWIKSLPRGDGLIVTAPGDEPGVDFLSRYFAPHAGIDEDPVTGSAHCTLAPYWAERLGKTVLTGHQVSRRGGLVGCRLEGGRVTLSGKAKLYLTGEIHVDA